MSKVRVLVVEDSITVRKHLMAVLNADPAIEVIAEAEDGKRAIELCETLRPDVVTLDMMLPIMSGLSATEYIMAYCPTPIMIVSSSTNRGELYKTYDALAAGAVEAMEKPGGDQYDRHWEHKFTSTVKLLAKIKVITHLRGRMRARHDYGPPAGVAKRTGTASGARQFRCVALGASTGGPAALLQILHDLPADFPLPILLVIHLSPLLGGGFADWLGSQSSLPVAFAVNGEPLPAPGAPRVVMALPDRHLLVRDGRLWLTNDPERFSCRPSVDVLFQSLARELGNQVIAGLLTGMGRDGAEGLLAIRQAGGLTLAQDEASCVVFGMPREAIQLGAAHRVIALKDFPANLVELAGTTVGSR